MYFKFQMLTMWILYQITLDFSSTHKSQNPLKLFEIKIINKKQDFKSQFQILPITIYLMLAISFHSLSARSDLIFIKSFMTSNLYKVIKDFNEYHEFKFSLYTLTSCCKQQ